MSHYSEQNEQYNKEQNAPKKTVLDAVDYFKANICEYDQPVNDSSGDLFIYESKVTGMFSSKVIETGFKLVCTIEEFNQCVKDMSNFAGKELRYRYNIQSEQLSGHLKLAKENSDYSHYKKQAAIKAMSKATNNLSEKFKALGNSAKYAKKELEKMNIKKPSKLLRLDYFLSLGLLTVKGDKYTERGMSDLDVFLADEMNTKRKGDEDITIDSLTPRKNTGEQPCGDDVPVVVEYADEFIEKACTYSFPNWAKGSHESDIQTWKPDLDALIKMQDEHDANKESRSKLKEKTEKAAKNLRSLVNDWKDSEQSKDKASENLLNAVYAQSIEQDEQGNVKITEPLPFVGFSKSLDDLKNIMKTVNERMKGMNEQLKYTSDIAITHKQPEANMICRVEYNCNNQGLTIADFTFKFESEHEYCGLDKDGHCMAIDKEEFIAFHAVDERSEMDVAKEKQVDLFYTKVHSKDNWHHITKDQLRFMQEKGMLAEIILPLEK